MPHEAQNEPIAVIGSGCRFPGGSNSPSKLWELLESPRDVSEKLGKGRFNIDRFYHPQGIHHGTTNARTGYTLSEDVRRFDAKFFSIPPGEAEAIDPQQRLLLEVVFEAVESAGLTLNTLYGSDTSCYVGIMCQDYMTIQGHDTNSVLKYAGTGIAASNASSRISYFFDWHGQSMTIDTACSSSMVCVHEAMQCLRNGNSRVAVACGTNLVLSPFMLISLSNLNMLSPNGRCYMWDERADGYARGEGVTCVVLKKLSDAIRDGDNIACVIREVGLNHDGKTRGLTMPSAEAQASLIKETYSRAGLDPSKKSDRCQLFEAHGTGTPIGDPREAEALSRAFFPDDDAAEGELLVGSIKTVIGHTEGSAGLAGIIKASLALQHGKIPPNLHFDKLNPALEPFVKHLRIPTELEPWPVVPEGQPRRASVNSFGFGGANGHAILEEYLPRRKVQSQDILESYEPQLRGIGASANGGYSESGRLTNGTQSNGSTAEYPAIPDLSEPAHPMIPFVFSAATDKSLAALLELTSEFVQSRSVDLPSLAYTLATKRSALSRRVAISARSVEGLLQAVKDTLEAATEQGSPSVFVPSPPSAQPVLAVFTGQGAQWPTMGSKLLTASPVAEAIVAHLDKSLSELPPSYRPEWTITEALVSGSKYSTAEAAISQPLCTAVQIVLVDLLRAAGVRFRAVIGHSSGEIAAAYAAGFLDAWDAIRIAYLRGFFAKLAAGATGAKGGMIAVGMDFEDASDLCQVDDLAGRVCVAAHNSPTSVTLSGDIDAVRLVQDVCEEEEKFCRVLRVDTAYHSPHMQRCSQPYLAALRDCCIQPLEPPEGAPEWFSSVYNVRITADTRGLDGQYWVDNMVRPVLFSSAVKTATTVIAGRSLKYAIEVGPHPALQGPTSESLSAESVQDITYIGTLRRGVDDVDAFSGALGAIWSRFGLKDLDLGVFQQICQPQVKLEVVLGLPSYPWDHDTAYWAEPRNGKLLSTQEGTFHDLLGLQTPDGLTDEWRWQNSLRLNELNWLSGHTLQGQVVFPATGYVCMVMEAAMQVVQGRSVQWIDVLDLEIRKAIAIQDNGTETLLSMTNVTPVGSAPTLITGDFKIFSTASKDSTQLLLNCCGSVRISLGTNWASRFPARRQPEISMARVDADRFYDVMRDEVGFGYTGPFRGIFEISRRLGFSTVRVRNTQFDDGETRLLFHPAMLDSALQGLNLAFCAPGDGRLWTLVAPTYCKRITLIPDLCGSNIGDEVAVDSTITDSRDTSPTGDIEVYSSDLSQKLVDIEGLKFSPLAPATAENDRYLYQESILCPERCQWSLVRSIKIYTPDEKLKSINAERAAFYFLKQLHLSVPQEERHRLPKYRQAMISNAERIYCRIKNGEHTFAPVSWIEDTREQISEIMDSYGPHDIDFNLTKAVGENIIVPEVLSGEVNILQYMAAGGMLERFYTEAIGFGVINSIMTGVVEQICNKFPRMNFLEVGAGTGGSTAAILSKIGDAFASYTYTDISSAFFERAQTRFQNQAHKMDFKTLDISKNPASQGFAPQTYDIVIAQNILHATASIKDSLTHARTLLKPGGYLVILELIRNDAIRFSLVVGCLPGWWVGEEDGRQWGPLLNLSEWEDLLVETGFSVETASPMMDDQDCGSTIVARATDTTISRLIEPLGVTPDIRQGRLLRVGGQHGQARAFHQSLSSLLGPHFGEVMSLDHLEDLESETVLPEGLHVLCLMDCDAHFWEDITEKTFENLKRLLASAADVLWILQGSRDSNPYAGATLGFLRSVCYELPQASLQSLDVGMELSKVSPSLVAECMLRLTALADMARRGKADEVLWHIEPELTLVDGRLHVVRLRPHVEQNLRYNSAKRPVQKLMDVSEVDSPLKLAWDSVTGTYGLYEDHEIQDVSDSDDYVRIKISCTFLASMKTPVGFVYVCLGTDVVTGALMLAFSDRQASIITVQRSWTIALEGPVGEHAGFMSFVIADLLTQTILRVLPYTGSVVVYNANPAATALLSGKMALLGRKIVSVTSDTNSDSYNAVYIHPYSLERDISAALPSDTALYIDGSPLSGSRGDDLGERIAASLPLVCEKLTISSIVGREASNLPTLAPDSIRELLRSVSTFASFYSQLGPVPLAGVAPIETLPLSKVVSVAETPPSSSLVYWEAEPYAAVAVRPMTERKDLFRPDRTYWLVGLAGELGRSIADFLAAHDAKHIVLSSRNPQVDQSWVDWNKARGVTVKYFAGDVTSYESVKQTHDQIIATMPPIAGVANGAMLLKDSTFMQEKYEDFKMILRPKIHGTVNLDRIFSSAEGQEPLDWFIGFSSIVAVIGNPGQCAYSAGNCFIKALVSDRRNRGLAGSVIDISRVIGIGYIERALTHTHQERLKNRSRALPMSEIDLHQLFAEAVVAGRPNSGLSPEIITGIGLITSEEAKSTYWQADPKLGLMIREVGRGTGVGGATGSAIPVRKLLESAKTPEAARKVIIGSLKAKLQATKFLLDGDSSQDTAPLQDLGIDSLIAVEIRVWFQRELMVDVPVMRILGGASMADLVDFVMERLPTDILVHIDPTGSLGKDRTLTSDDQPANVDVAESSVVAASSTGSQVEKQVDERIVNGIDESGKV